MSDVEKGKIMNQPKPMTSDSMSLRESRFQTQESKVLSKLESKTPSLRF